MCRARQVIKNFFLFKIVFWLSTELYWSEILHGCRRYGILSVRAVQRLVLVQSGDRYRRSAVRTSADWSVCDTWLRAPWLFRQRGRSARPGLLRSSVVPVQCQLHTRHRQSVPEGPHCLSGSHVPLYHAYDLFFCCFITSAKEVMYLSLSLDLSVSRITQKVVNEFW